MTLDELVAAADALPDDLAAMARAHCHAVNIDSVVLAKNADAIDTDGLYQRFDDPAHVRRRVREFALLAGHGSTESRQFPAGDTHPAA